MKPSEKALKYFKQAEDVDPNFYSMNLLMIGKTYVRLQNYRLALLFLSRAKDYPVKTPDDQQAHKEAVELLKSIGIKYAIPYSIKITVIRHYINYLSLLIAYIDIISLQLTLILFIYVKLFSLTIFFQHFDMQSGPLWIILLIYIFNLLINIKY
ncbi:hypothetical protein KUTeg_019314 [Tegillarca granosa]|uniref:Uncharacterized protein n=1 Tax=Tegillarca granosa TaxID=220873 RepID=A0ABQ9EC66_TEGGR|nr:hypothetical protein KUTeg_019314 [Tegillarca granosa]